MKRLLILLSLTVFLTHLARSDDTGLVLMYNDLDPYIYSENGQVAGFLSSYAIDVTKDAKISPLWRNIPWDKQLDILRRNQANVCSIGLFKTAERETYLKFTAPIGVDDSFVLVANKANPAMKKHQQFKDVLNDKNLKPILQINTVYNTYIDTLLAAKGLPKLPGSIPRMMRMLVNNPQSYIIVTQMTGQTLINKNGFTDTLMAFDHYEDLRDTSPYFIACSLKTDDVIFNRLNQSIISHGIAKPS